MKPPVALALSFVLGLATAAASGLNPIASADGFTRIRKPASADATVPLLDEATRPTVEQIQRERARLESSPLIRNAATDPRLNAILSEGPALIARLEAAYPGAIWAPLGRDSAFLADLLEAYYLSIGEPNRVRRLGASGSSFNGRDLRLQFLKSNGLELDANGIPKRPFVIIDATSWSGTLNNAESQIRRLVASLYEITPEAKRRELLTRLTAVGQGGNSGHNMNGEEMTSGDRILSFLQLVNVGKAGPERILYVSGAFSYGDLHWHEGFGLFQESSPGRVAAPPGALAAANIRLTILRSVLNLSDSVASPEFHKRVQSEASRIGFDLDWHKRNRDLIDQDEFDRLKTQRQWSAQEIRELSEHANPGMPPGFRIVISNRIVELMRLGLRNKAISTSDYGSLIRDIFLTRAIQPDSLLTLMQSHPAKTARALEEWKGSTDPQTQTFLHSILLQILEHRPHLAGQAPFVELISAKMLRDKANATQDWSKKVVYARAALERASTLDEFLDASLFDRSKLDWMNAQLLDHEILTRWAGRWLGDVIQNYGSFESRIGRDENKKTLQSIVVSRIERTADLMSWLNASSWIILSPDVVGRIFQHRDHFSASQLFELSERADEAYQASKLFQYALERAQSFDEFLDLAKPERRQKRGRDSHILESVILQAWNGRWPQETRDRYRELESLLNDKEHKAGMQKRVAERSYGADDFPSWLLKTAGPVRSDGLANVIETQQTRFTSAQLRQLMRDAPDFHIKLRLFGFSLNQAQSFDEFLTHAKFDDGTRALDWERRRWVGEVILRSWAGRWPQDVASNYVKLESLLSEDYSKPDLQATLIQSGLEPALLIEWLKSPTLSIRHFSLVHFIKKHLDSFNAEQLGGLTDRCDDPQLKFSLMELGLQRAESFEEFLAIARLGRSKKRDIYYYFQEQQRDEAIVNALGMRWPDRLLKQAEEFLALLSTDSYRKQIESRLESRLQEAEDIAPLAREASGLFLTPSVVERVGAQKANFTGSELRQMADRAKTAPTMLQLFRFALERAETFDEFLELSRLDRSRFTAAANRDLDDALVKGLGSRWQDQLRARYADFEKRLEFDDRKADLQTALIERFSDPKQLTSWVQSSWFTIRSPRLVERIKAARNQFSARQLRELMHRSLENRFKLEFFEAALSRAESIEDFLELARIDRAKLTPEQNQDADETIQRHLEPWLHLASRDYLRTLKTLVSSKPAFQRIKSAARSAAAANPSSSNSGATGRASLIFRRMMSLIGLGSRRSFPVDPVAPSSVAVDNGQSSVMRTCSDIFR